MSAASRNRTRTARRWRWSAAIGALVVVGGYVGCGFPDYTYDDNAFYDASAGASAGAGGSSASGGSSGTGASAGTGGSVTGGSGGVGGSTGGSGGTAGTGGTSGAGGTAGTGGAGGFAGTENCTNGKDDDGNGKVDCQDPACQSAGYSCAPTVVNWNGPVAMWSGATGSAPSCTGDYISPATSGKSNLQPGTATCQTCSCGTPSGGSCSTVNIEYFDSNNCNQGCWGCPPNTPFTLTDGAACKVFGEIHGPSGESPKAAMFTTPTASGSTCTPSSTGTANIPTPTWGNAMVACGGEPGGGRGCGDVTTECVPKPASPFNAICIYKTGDNACPAGAYTNKHLYYTGYSDGRSCDACTCGTPTGQSCTGTVKTYTDSCVSDLTTLTTPNQCTAIPADPTTATYDGGLEDTRGATYTGGTPSGGSCAPSGGGQPTGTVTETGPITFCCI